MRGWRHLGTSASALLVVILMVVTVTGCWGRRDPVPEHTVTVTADPNRYQFDGQIMAYDQVQAELTSIAVEPLATPGSISKSSPIPGPITGALVTWSIGAPASAWTKSRRPDAERPPACENFMGRRIGCLVLLLLIAWLGLEVLAYIGVSRFLNHHFERYVGSGGYIIVLGWIVVSLVVALKVGRWHVARVMPGLLKGTCGRGPRSRPDRPARPAQRHPRPHPAAATGAVTVQQTRRRRDGFGSQTQHGKNDGCWLSWWKLSWWKFSRRRIPRRSFPWHETTHPR